MEMISALVEKYAEQYTSENEKLLHEIHLDTLKNHKEARMLSTEVQGKFLSFISKLIKPKYILEVGTFVGYSALCLCEGLQAGGELHTIELQEGDAATAKANFKAAKKDKEIHLHTGNALQVIPSLNFMWDLVFIDADKVGYIEYYELALARLSEDGLIIADNVLFHGEVLEPVIKGKSAKAIDAFNKHVAADKRTEQVLLTIRDGLLLILKNKIQ
jgi:predicted O-methyltransferase YrrM